MARHKEFDRDAVLDKAMELFWDNGYEATSVQDLLDTMGINRGSLYDTFGDKRALFFAAIDRYYDKVLSCTVASLEAPGSARRAIVRAVEGMLDCACDGSSKRGCFVTNSAVELAPHCAETSSRVARYYGRLEEAFVGAVERAQRAGEIGTRHDARALARFLTCSLQGLVVVSKVDPDPSVLRDITSVIIAALD